MILNEYALGHVAINGLLKRYQETKFDKKLDIEYFKDSDYHFIKYAINNEVHEGFKHCRFEGKDYYELSIDNLSIPQNHRSHLNVFFTLTFIPESQELIDKTLFASVVLNLPRLTDSALFLVVQDALRNHQDTIIDFYKAGQFGSISDINRKRISLDPFQQLSQDERELRRSWYD